MNCFYKEEFKVDIMPSKSCYYLSSTEKNKSYILVIDLESKKFKKKYGNEYYLFKSNNKYKISDSEMREIQIIIKNECNYKIVN